MNAKLVFALAAVGFIALASSASAARAGFDWNPVTGIGSQNSNGTPAKNDGACRSVRDPASVSK